MKDRTSTSITKAWLTLQNCCKTSGLNPTTYIQDNEVSQSTKEVFHKEGIPFKLVSPYLHRANADERAIQTFKSHFIACLSRLDPNFPIKQWNILVPQA